MEKIVSKRQLPESTVAQSCDFDSCVARVRQICERRHVYMKRNVKRDVCIRKEMSKETYV